MKDKNEEMTRSDAVSLATATATMLSLRKLAVEFNLDECKVVEVFSNELATVVDLFAKNETEEIMNLVNQDPYVPTDSK